MNKAVDRVLDELCLAAGISRQRAPRETTGRRLEVVRLGRAHGRELVGELSCEDGAFVFRYKPGYDGRSILLDRTANALDATVGCVRRGGLTMEEWVEMEARGRRPDPETIDPAHCSAGREPANLYRFFSPPAPLTPGLASNFLLRTLLALPPLSALSSARFALA